MVLFLQNSYMNGASIDRKTHRWDLHERLADMQALSFGCFLSFFSSSAFFVSNWTFTWTWINEWRQTFFSSQERRDETRKEKRMLCANHDNISRAVWSFGVVMAVSQATPGGYLLENVIIPSLLVYLTQNENVSEAPTIELSIKEIPFMLNLRQQQQVYILVTYLCVLKASKSLNLLSFYADKIEFHLSREIN